MDLNANDLASLNIMEYSLCLDDHPATPPVILKPSTTKGGNFAKLKSSIINKTTSNNNETINANSNSSSIGSFKFDKQINTFNSFYLTNDFDSGGGTGGGGGGKEQMNKFQKIDNIEEEEDVDHVEDDEDEVVFNLKGEYEQKSDTSQNKRNIKVNQYSSVNNNNNDNTIINSNGAISCSNNNSNGNTNNVIELDSVKHKLSSIWNNVKYGKNILF